MLGQVRVNSLIGLGITTPDNYDALVDYVRNNTDADNIEEIIKSIPDGYIKDSDIFWDFTDNAEMLELIVKKMCKEELSELYEHLSGNPMDDINEHVTSLSIVINELGNIADVHDHNLAPLAGKKLSDFDNEFPVELSTDTFEYFLLEDIYEADQLLTLIRLASTNTVDHYICESLVYHMMNDPYVINAATVMWNEVNIANEFVFRCIQTDTDLIYNEEFGYLLELMDKDLPYYMLRYGMHQLGAQDILQQVEDFPLMISNWQKSDICECKMFKQLLQECKAIDDEFYNKIKECGIGYNANYELETLIGVGEVEDNFEDDISEDYLDEE